jgi:hypothetical protein
MNPTGQDGNVTSPFGSFYRCVLADLDEVATCVRVWRVFKDGKDSATGAVNFAAKHVE